MIVGTKDFVSVSRWILKPEAIRLFFFFFNSPLSHFSLSGGIEHRNWNSGSWYMYSVSVCKRLRLFAAVQRRTLYAKDIKYTMGEKDSTKHADANECYKERKREHLPSLPHSTTPHSPNPPPTLTNYQCEKSLQLHVTSLAGSTAQPHQKRLRFFVLPTSHMTGENCHRFHSRCSLDDPCTTIASP